MGEADEAFVQALGHRPKLSITEDEGIPLIDLSPLSSPNGANTKHIDDLVVEIGNACKTWGFFQVINHGVPLEKRQKVEDAMRKFFAQPLEEKRKVRKDEKKAVGYYDNEHTKNVRDWKEVFDFVADKRILMAASHEPEDKEVPETFNQWPDYPPELSRWREKRKVRRDEKEGGVGIMTPSIPKNVRDWKEVFDFVVKSPCLMPASSDPEDKEIAETHKDAGALTVLAQDDVGGLEVKRKSDGEWVRVKPTPDAYIINVGDIIQVWSNDAYESVEHRVMVNSEKERFSIPFFFFPSHYTMVKPLDELTNEQNPAKYRAYSWGKFLTTRKGSNFKKLDVENVQIYHFRVQELADKLERALSINSK
ncbi:hypothetical protein CUMW_279440 [Citrus unshiu]|uniref:Fe2OG dioxygenase domain-containing protein n=1 Tax=Citrus unshiu TaxID=55188 RepID=A0A2H5N8Q7_CITUN|nr:hypothetical protein CUMW_279440 [Citrus unshiu]